MPTKLVFGKLIGILVNTTGRSGERGGNTTSTLRILRRTAHHGTANTLFDVVIDHSMLDFGEKGPTTMTESHLLCDLLEKATAFKALKHHVDTPGRPRRTRTRPRGWGESTCA